MDNIQVSVRVRPLIQRELNSGLPKLWKIKDNSIAENKGNNIPYVFDNVFDQNVTTSVLYDIVAKPILEACMQGFNGTIFAYGQTSSGKTHTMMGNDTQTGIIPLSLSQIFQAIENSPKQEFLLRVSYMEIYNENLSDLLGKDKNIKITDTHGVIGLEETVVTTPRQILDIMKKGEARRHIGETNMNERSSRSHTIFRMIIESHIRDEEGEGAVNVAHLNLVDLAGSERVAATGATGERLREGCHINKSLFMLGHCISQLSENPNAFINFRDSKLTRILQNALGGNSKTAIICNVTPASIEETHSTLKFASSAKKIRNKPVVNEVLSDEALLKRYKREIAGLKKKIDNLVNTDVQSENEGLQKKLEMQGTKIEHLKKLICVSSITSMPPPAAIPMKKRRETWCPGRIQKIQQLSNNETSIAGLLVPQRVPVSESGKKTLSVMSQAKREVKRDIEDKPSDSFSDVSFQALGDVSTVFREAEANMEMNDSLAGFVTPHIACRKRSVRFTGIDETHEISPRCNCNTMVPMLKDQISEHLVTIRSLQDDLVRVNDELNVKNADYEDLKSFTEMELDNTMSARQMEVLTKITEEKEEILKKSGDSEKRIDSLLNQIADLKLENKHLISLTSNNDDSSSKGTSLNEILANAEKEKFELKETIEKQKKLLDEQDVFVKEAKTVKEDAVSKIEIAVKQKEDAERNLAEVEIQKESTDRTLMRYESEISASRERIQELSSNVGKSCNDRDLDALEKDNMVIKQKCEDLELQVKDAKDQLEMAKSEREVLDIERISLQNEKELLEKDLSEIHLALISSEQVQEQNVELGNLVKELEAVLNQSQEKIQVLNDKIILLEKTNLELMNEKTELEENNLRLTNQNENGQRELEDLKSRNSSSSCDSEETKILQEKLTALQEQLENLQLQYDCLNDKMKLDDSGREKEVKTLEDCIDDLKTTVENNDAKITELENCNSSLETAKLELERRLETGEKTFSDQNEMEEDLGEEKCDIEDLKSENCKLTEQLNQYKATIEKGQVLVKNLNAEKNEILDELDNLEYEKEDLLKKIQSMENNVSDLEMKFELANKQLRDTVTEKSDIEERFERLVVEKESVELKLRCGDMSVISTENESSQFDKEQIEKLLSKKETIERKLMQVTNDWETAQEEIKTLRQINETHDSELVNQLQKDKSALIEKMEALKVESHCLTDSDELNGIKLELTAMIKDKEDFERKYHSLEKDNTELNNELKSLKNELQLMADDKADIEDRFERLILQKEEIESKLNQSDRECSTVAASGRQFQLESENESLLGKVNELLKESESSAKTIQNLQDDLNEAKEATFKMDKEIQFFQNEKQDFSTKYDLLVSEKECLSKDFDELKASMVSLEEKYSQEMSDIMEKIMIFKTENETLNERVVGLELEKKKNDDQVHSLTEKNSELLTDLVKYSDDLNSLLKEKEQLSAEIGHLNEKVKGLNVFVEEVNDLKSVIDELEQEKQNSLVTAAAKLESLDSEKQQIADKYSETLKELSQSRLQTDELRSINETLSSELNVLEKHIVELSSSKEQSTALLEELERLNECIKQLEQDKKNLKQTRDEQLKNVQLENEKLMGGVEKLSSEKVQLQNEICDLAKSAEQQKCDFIQEQKHLREIIENIKHESNDKFEGYNHELKNMMSEVHKLTEEKMQLADVLNEKESVIEELDNHRKAAEISATDKLNDLLEELATMKKKNSALEQEKIEDKENYGAQQEALTTEMEQFLKDAEKEYKELEQTNLQLTEKVKELECNKTECQPDVTADLAVAKKQLAMKDKEISALDNEQDRLKKIIDEMDEEVDAEKVKVQSLNAELQNMKKIYAGADYEELVQINQQLTERLKELECNKAECQPDVELAATKKQLAIKDKAIDSLDSELDRLRDIIDGMDDEIDAEKVKVESLEAELQKLRSVSNSKDTDTEGKELKKELQRYRFEIVELEAKLRNVDSDKDKQLEYLKGENNYLNEYVRNLKDNLRRQTSDLDSTVAELNPRSSNPAPPDHTSISGSGIIDSAVICSLQSQLKTFESKNKELELNSLKNERKMKHMKRIIVNYENELALCRDLVLNENDRGPLRDVTNTQDHHVKTTPKIDNGSPVPEISPIADADEACASAAPAFDPATYLQPIPSKKPSDYYRMLYGKDVKESPRTRLADLMKDEKLPADIKPEPKEHKKTRTVKEMILEANDGECPVECKTS